MRRFVAQPSKLARQCLMVRWWWAIMLTIASRLTRYRRRRNGRRESELPSLEIHFWSACKSAARDCPTIRGLSDSEGGLIGSGGILRVTGLQTTTHAHFLNCRFLNRFSTAAFLCLLLLSSIIIILSQRTELTGRKFRR